MRQRDDVRKHWLTILGIAIMTIATVALALMSIGVTRGNVPNAGQTPGYTPESEETDAGEEDKKDLPPPAEEKQLPVTVPALTRVLGVQDAEAAYRATTGPCPEAGFNLETTWDGGQNWVIQAASADLGLNAVRRILAGDDGFLTVLALHQEDCANAVMAESYDYGAAWSPVETGPNVTWHVSPTSPTEVIAPEVGAVTVPCEASRIASLGVASAGVLCADGRLATTDDAGANWNLTDPQGGAVALGATGDRYLLAQTGTADCEGTAVTRFTSDREVDSVACLADVPAGETAVAGNANNVAWLWAGDQIRRSTDGGVTWVGGEN